MDIWEIDKLMLFIAIKCYQLIFPGTERPTSEKLLDAVAYSSINYALLILPIIAVEKNQLDSVHPFLYYLFYIFVLLLAPIMWVLV